jgi:hypothetical protein
VTPEDGTPFTLIAKQVHYYTWINHKRIARIDPDPDPQGTSLKVTTNDGRWCMVNLHYLQTQPGNVKPEIEWHEP